MYLTVITKKIHQVNYCNVRSAYRCVKGAPLGNSDHNMVYAQPIYKRKLQQEKPHEIQVSQYTPEALNNLSACFDLTDWELFKETSSDINELTDVVTSCIHFNTQTIIP